jgi:DNA primase
MARIPQEKIEEVRASADIVSYISKYVRLKKSGRNFFGLCPFHQEKTASFSVSPDKKIFHCFGCQKGGDIIGFLMEVEKISYIEAIRRIAFDLGITLPTDSVDNYSNEKDVYDKYYNINNIAKDFFVEQFTKGKQNPARNYILNRKFKVSTIKKYLIGYAPNKWDSLINHMSPKNSSKENLVELGLIFKKDNENIYFDKFRNRLIFPFQNISGRIIGFGGRKLNEEDNPKYLNSPESKIYQKGSTLYGLHQAISAIREQNTVILVEGYFDLLRLVNSGIANVVASSGTAVTENQGRLLKRYTPNVIISYDSDEAGIKAAIRNSEILENLDMNISIVQLPEPHDPDSYILEFGRNSYLQLVKNKKNPLDIKLLKFFKDFSNPSLEQKYKFLDEIIYQLISLPNDVKIGFYLHKLAESMGITESLLVSRFNKQKKSKKYFINNQNQNEKVNEKTGFNIKKGEWKAEEGILTILLKGNTDKIKEILNSLSSSDFENEDLRQIFEMIVHHWEDKNIINLSQLQNALSNELKEILIGLSFNEIENISKFTNDCIYKLRKWHLNARYTELRRMLQEESDSEKSVKHYMKQLNDLKKKLIEVENNHHKSKL